MKLDELKEKKVSDLREIAKTMGIEKITSFSKDELIVEIMKNIVTSLLIYLVMIHLLNYTEC